MGSHHQKFVVLRHDEDPSKDVAFAGGIDLCHGRRDDADHRGDPQPLPMAAAYGPSPPWHDVQLQIRGPAVHVLDTVFRERWDDPNSPDADHPIAWIHDKLHHTRLHADPLPPQLPPPPECGPHFVQTLRTYPAIRPPYDFAPDGERSVARGYTKAIKRAHRLIYLEDQYMWSADVARLFAEALTDHPELHLVVVVPRFPDQEGAFAERPELVGRWQALEMCKQAGQGPGARLRRGEPRPGTRSTCTPRSAWSTTSGRAWAATTSTGARGPTTASSPAPSWTRPAIRASRPTRPATGEGARDLRPRPAAGARARAPRSRRRRPRGRRDARPGTASSRRSTPAPRRWTRGTRADGRAPGRPAGCGRTARSGCRCYTRLWATPVYRLLDDPDGRPLRMRLKKTF